jgi:hypothetical protein
MVISFYSFVWEKAAAKLENESNISILLEKRNLR